MALSIRELKGRYKTNLALGRALPTHDLGIPLPFSTGEPLYDAALTDKLAATTTMNEPEHLRRAWHLVRESSPKQRETLAANGRRLLNDYKLLLALRSLELGELGLAEQFLRSLPWRWRFGFPAAAIKPASQIFTGWRRTLDFRLVEPPFDALRLLFRDTLAHAPGVAILKYRATIKESAALLRYRFEGDRERAIHDLCFEDGREGARDPRLEPIGTYLAARAAIKSGLGPFLGVLERAETEIPITSFMGLLGSHGTKLTDNRVREQPALRRYAVRCATVVESLLRLAEWAPWMQAEHAEALARTVRQGVIERGIDVPFGKVLKAFMAAPQHVRKMVREPLLVPLLRHFGTRVAGLLPPPGPLSYVQPGNIIHLMSFLLYAVVSSAMKTRLTLVYADGVEEVAPLDFDEVTRHLADDQQELERWLLSELGGLTSQRTYVYDYSKVARAISKLDPEAPLLVDLPFADSMDVLSALLPCSRVFNLNAAYGAPGEVCVAYEYYAKLFIATPRFNYGVWSRYSDSAATKFADLLEKLESFQVLGAVS